MMNHENFGHIFKQTLIFNQQNGKDKWKSMCIYIYYVCMYIIVYIHKMEANGVADCS